MMNSVKSAAIALGLASALALPSAVFAAGPATSPLPETVRTHQPPAAPVALVFKNLYETWGEAIFAALPAGTFTPLDGLTKVKCAPAAGCTIIAETNAQVVASVDGTQWAICTQVDGAFANNGCYYQGAANVADGYKKGNDRENWHVTAGTHTVQTFIYPTSAMTLNAYQDDYVILTP